MNKNIALVLSGGGARGIAHIGVIEELEKQGFHISSIAGTSMGALVGGVYATGKLEEYKNWMISLDRKKVFQLIDFTLSRHGLVKGDRVLNKMKDFIPDTNIEDLNIPFAAIAANIMKKKEIVFTSGSLYDAIRASISIPSVLTPVKTQDGLLVDGGVLNNIPLNRVKRTKGDILVGVYVNANIPVNKPILSKKINNENLSNYQKKIKEFYSHLLKTHPLSHEEKFGYFDLINNTISLMTYHMAEMTIQFNPPDILVEVSSDSCGTFDFYKAQEMVEMGRHAAKKSLEEYFLNKKSSA